MVERRKKIKRREGFTANLGMSVGDLQDSSVCFYVWYEAAGGPTNQTSTYSV